MADMVHLRRCAGDDVDLVPLFLGHHLRVDGHGALVGLEDDDVGGIDEVVVAHGSYLAGFELPTVLVVERGSHGLETGQQGGAATEGFLLCSRAEGCSAYGVVVGEVEHGDLLAAVGFGCLEAPFARADIRGMAFVYLGLGDVLVVIYHELTADGFEDGFMQFGIVFVLVLGVGHYLTVDLMKIVHGMIVNKWLIMCLMNVDCKVLGRSAEGVGGLAHFILYVPRCI